MRLDGSELNGAQAGAWVVAIHLDIEKKLDGFTLQIQLNADDMSIALLGASGSGKSMTLRCIAGIETPDSGKIVIDGKTVFDSEQHINLKPQQRQVGFLFQNYALFQTMTVRQNICCGARRTGHTDKIESLIEQFELVGLENRFPSELSGGQQQRVALARILASEPRVLLLDEPFSALDTFLRWQVEQQIFGILQQFEGTSILVSHNREEAYRLCDQIAVLANGSTRGLRPKQELFAHPHTKAEAYLIGMENVVDVQPMGADGFKIPAWGISVDCDCTAVAVAVAGKSFSCTALENGIAICGTITQILQGPNDIIVLIRPLHTNGLLHWTTDKLDLSVGQTITLWLSCNDIHYLIA